MGLGLYRRKPTVVSAIQVQWSTWDTLRRLMGVSIASYWTIEIEAASDTCGDPGPDYLAFTAPTAHGDVATFRHGDWVLRDSKLGTWYPVKPDVFAATYEEVI